MAAVADLIEMVFSAQQPFTGGAIIDEMRRWASHLPLLAFLKASAALPKGFVWEKDGQIVGNINVGQVGSSGRDWLISNVAVHPDHRQQGIAHQLLRAGLDYVAWQGGDYAVLQVRRDNQVAQHLYDAFGFQRVYRTVELCYPIEQRRRISVQPYSHYRRFRAKDRVTVRRIIRQAVPFHLQRFLPLFTPVIRHVRNPDWLGWLDDLLEGRQTKRLVTTDDDQVTGFIVAQARRRPRSYHQLFIAIHPRHRNTRERAMVQQGLAMLNVALDHPILTSVPARETTVQEALQESGFTIIRHLDHMTKRIKAPHTRGSGRGFLI
jgi:ribosomal protein S18 acetylase RimI-like enzyme